MASFEGSIGTPSGAFNLKVEYSYSQSVSGNYSDVTATGYVKRNRTSVSPYNSSSSSSLVINGTSKGYSGSYDLRSDGYKTITSNTVRVYHNNDGTKSITVSFSFNGNLSSYYPNGSISKSITLNTIPRAATTTSGTDFNDTGNPTIKFSNPGGFSLMPYLNFYLNGSVVVNLTRNKGSYSSLYTWSLTSAERTQILNALKNVNSCQLTEGVDTYNGSTKLGYSSVTKTFTIVNANPTFSNFEFEDINATTLALTGNNQNIIPGYSTVKATIPVGYIATANKQATMSKYSFTCGTDQRNITYSPTEATYNTIENVQAGIFNVYAIDSRNNSTMVTKNANETISYTPLIKGNISISRQNGVSEYTTLSFNGKADLVDFGQVINSIQESKFRYKTTDSSTWSNYSDLTLTIDGEGNFSFEDLIEGDTSQGFDINNSYNIEVLVADELSTITYTANLGSGIPNIALHKNGVGIMGKYDTTEGGLLQVASKNILKLIGEVVVDYTFTNNTTQSISFDVDISPGEWLDVVINGGVTTAGDVYLRLNDNSGNNYFQSGYYFNGSISSGDGGSLSGANGYRRARAQFYYGRQMSPLWSIVSDKIGFVVREGTRYYPCSKWSSNVSYDANQALSSGIGLLNVETNSITKVTYIASNGYFKEGTRITIVKTLNGQM